MNWFNNAIDFIKESVIEPIVDFVEDKIIDPILQWIHPTPVPPSVPSNSSVPDMPSTINQSDVSKIENIVKVEKVELPEVDVDEGMEGDLEGEVYQPPYKEDSRDTPYHQPKDENASKKSRSEKIKQKVNTQSYEKKNSIVEKEGCGDCKTALWMTIAQKEAKLIKGKNEKKIPIIVKKYHKYAAPKSNFGPSISWCASFVSWTLNEGAIKNIHSTSSQFFRYGGKTIKISKPFYGAIAVWKDHKKVNGKYKHDGHGHVSYVYGKLEDGQLLFLGGNQGNTLKISMYNITGKMYYNHRSGGKKIYRKFAGFYKPKKYKVKSCEYKLKKYKSLDSANKQLLTIAIKTVKNEST